MVRVFYFVLGFKYILSPFPRLVEINYKDKTESKQNKSTTLMECMSKENGTLLKFSLIYELSFTLASAKVTSKKSELFLNRKLWCFYNGRKGGHCSIGGCKAGQISFL